jgi:hypothetical protein
MDTPTELHLRPRIAGDAFEHLAYVPLTHGVCEQQTRNAIVPGLDPSRTFEARNASP